MERTTRKSYKFLSDVNASAAIAAAFDANHVYVRVRVVLRCERAAAKKLSWTELVAGKCKTGLGKRRRNERPIQRCRKIILK